MSASGDHDGLTSSSKCDTSAIAEEIAPLEKKTKGGLIIIDLPPPPKDVCRVFDPVMKNDMRAAVFSTIFCWLPLGIVPVLIGLISICYAKKAQDCKDPQLRQVYSNRSSTITWIGIMLFISILTIATVIVATCGIL